MMMALLPILIPLGVLFAYTSFAKGNRIGFFFGIGLCFVGATGFLGPRFISSSGCYVDWDGRSNSTICD